MIFPNTVVEQGEIARSMWLILEQRAVEDHGFVCKRDCDRGVQIQKLEDRNLNY